MNLPTTFIYIVTLVLLSIDSLRGSSSTSLLEDPFLGIPPEDVKYYSSSHRIKCKDGSKEFTRAQLNDDFCDCFDGTDEPGTSACPNGKFYCRNAGHVPVIIFSSRVNDGICDCCDGSDEYNDKVKCLNTCREAGKGAGDELKRIAMYQEGVAIRKQEVEQAKVALAKDEEELSRLKSEEKVLKLQFEQLKERKEQIEKAEGTERMRKENEERDKREAEEKAGTGKSKTAEEINQERSEKGRGGESDTAPTGRTNDERIRLVDDYPSDQGDDASENAEGLSKEELGRLVASRWTREKTEKESRDDFARDIHEEQSSKIQNDVHDDIDDIYALETADSKKNEYDMEDGFDEDSAVEYRYNFSSHYYPEAESDSDDESDGDSDDEIDSDSDDELDFFFFVLYLVEELDLEDLAILTIQKIFYWVENMVLGVLQAVNIFQIPVDMSEAAQVRKEYDELSTKLSEIQSRISSLSQKLKHDFGPEKEFYSYYGRCFESEQNKYIYKVCPFEEASQQEGHSTTRLGKWDKFDDSYRVMIFTNGDKCWNGPDRSMKVKLRCGLKNEVADVDEPSRCKYEALLSTPALCSEDKLKDLRDKLDTTSKELMEGHDEL